MRPPTGSTIIDHLFGLSFLTVRWYGVLIVSGAILAGYLATRRDRAHGIDEEHVWNQLLLGMFIGIICARIYYVAFEWQRYAGRPLLEIINPQGGGIAIHGAIIGALLSVLLYTRRQRLPLLTWLDICWRCCAMIPLLGWPMSTIRRQDSITISRRRMWSSMRYPSSPVSSQTNSTILRPC
jgi:prolipoprotein diacylglyceryl transferase